MVGPGRTTGMVGRWRCHLNSRGREVPPPWHGDRDAILVMETALSRQGVEMSVW